MPHSKAAKASVEAATADPAAVPAAHPRGESRLPFSVKPTAKPTINPEDKTAASTAKCVGTVKVVAPPLSPPLSPRARLTARRSPPGSAAPPRTNFLIHTRSSLICWSRNWTTAATSLPAGTGSPGAEGNKAPPTNVSASTGAAAPSTCSPTDMNTSSSDVAVTETSTRPKPSASASSPSKRAATRALDAWMVYVVVTSRAESSWRGASASAQFRDAEKLEPRVAFRSGLLNDEEKLFGVDPSSGFAASVSVARRRSSSSFEAAASLAPGICCAKTALS
mmetsp:Transcript_12892/g.34182  ORF Transcript_12892/g.34182 Transcript_12892/m.34182 type:complete len:279 (+) Transcript_12892:626-1462(+)